MPVLPTNLINRVQIKQASTKDPIPWVVLKTLEELRASTMKDVGSDRIKRGWQ
jgi:hypothetical protein